MTLTFEAVKRWVMEQFHSKREHISATRGISDAYRPVIVGSDGKLDGSLIDRADIFSDAEGDPANIGTAADGTSTYASRRDHVHAATNAGITTAMFSDTEGDPAAVGTAADGTSTYAARRNHVHDIAADYVDNTRLRDSGALSVIGRSANSTGDPADISATAASDAVLRESGSVLGFGTIATAGIAANAVSNDKLAQMAQATIKGRASAAGTGDPTDLTAAEVASILSTAGTWSPTLTFGGGSTGLTYTTRVGRYRQQGAFVTASLYIVLSAKGSSTGSASITLPVATANVTSAFHAVSVWANTLTGISGALMGYVAPNSTAIAMEFLGTGTITTLTDAHFNNTSAVMITVTYLAA